MSSGFRGPIVFGPEVSNKSYAYRRGTGMVPSAEWSVFIDDFYSWVVGTSITNGPVANTPWGWQGAIIDAGATVTVNTTAAIGANGVLTFADATLSEGASIYGTEALQLTSGKKFWMEMRFRTDDVTDNTIQFGLADLSATTNPEDLWTAAGCDNFLTVGIIDGGGGAIRIMADASNAGLAAVNSSTQTLTANTWNILALEYDGAGIASYLNGQAATLTSDFVSVSRIPTGVSLAPFIGHINGNGAGGNVVVVDYIRWVSQR